MTAFEFAICTAAVCGPLLVIGGVLGILRRTISLTRQPGGDGGFRVEFQGLKLTTDMPVIALFTIGLLFCFVALHYGQPQTITVRVHGHLDGEFAEDASIWVAMPLDKVETQTDGRSIDHVIYRALDPDNLTLEICMPKEGCTRRGARVIKDTPGFSGLKPRTVNLDVIHLAGGAPKPTVNPANIDPPAPSLHSVDQSDNS
jgi:hypothetical protein